MELFRGLYRGSIIAVVKGYTRTRGNLYMYTDVNLCTCIYDFASMLHIYIYICMSYSLKGVL